MATLESQLREAAQVAKAFWHSYQPAAPVQIQLLQAAEIPEAAR